MSAPHRAAPAPAPEVGHRPPQAGPTAPPPEVGPRPAADAAPKRQRLPDDPRDAAPGRQRLPDDPATPRATAPKRQRLPDDPRDAALGRQRLPTDPVTERRPADARDGDAPATATRPDRTGGPIRLARSEATRLQAVALLGCALTLPAALARLTPPQPPAPLASCAAQAVSRDGSVYCQGPGRALAPGQALWVGLRFDVNTASAQTLALVPGIGPKLAARLVADRAERGPFHRIQDTTRVRGIGPKLSARIAAYAQVSPQDRNNAQPIGPPRPSRTKPSP